MLKRIKTNKSIEITLMTITYIILTSLIFLSFRYNTNNISSPSTTQNNAPTEIQTIAQVDEPKITEPVLISEFYYVDTDILNVRSAPSIESEKITQYVRDQKLEVINKSETWYQTKDGFIHSDYLITINKYNENIKKYVISRGSLPLDFIRSTTLDIRTRSNLTINDLRLLLKDTELEGIEKSILDVEDKYKINGFFTLAVARLESGNGTSPIARDKNNLFGMNALDGDAYASAYSYKSKSDSVHSFGKTIKTRYIDNGTICISEINPIYCSNSDWGIIIIKLIKEDYERVKR